MPAGTAGTPPVLWHNGGAPGCPFNSGDINTVEATAGAVYVGGHLTAEALPAGLAIGGDFQGAGGTTHRGFALFPGAP